MVKRRNQIKRCLCPCNRELPPRYKGREKIFFEPECRDSWGMLPDSKKLDRLAETWSFLNEKEKIKRLDEINCNENDVFELIEKKKED
ncbi:hypothetical protein [Nitrosopumilus sp.]|uniref:hypothetical protein n=1 Tax=Nitrosopumilus sp. TaxID=2024843 RepID=UPI003D0C07E1